MYNVRQNRRARFVWNIHSCETWLKSGWKVAEKWQSRSFLSYWNISVSCWKVSVCFSFFFLSLSFRPLPPSSSRLFFFCWLRSPLPAFVIFTKSGTTVIKRLAKNTWPRVHREYSCPHRLETRATYQTERKNCVMLIRENWVFSGRVVLPSAKQCKVYLPAGHPIK